MHTLKEFRGAICSKNSDRRDKIVEFYSKIRESVVNNLIWPPNVVAVHMSSQDVVNAKLINFQLFSHTGAQARF